MNKLKKVILKLSGVILLLLIAAYFVSTKPKTSNDNSTPSQNIITTHNDSYELEGPYPVLYVLDGDTFRTIIDGEEITVRLIGVDTPESVNKVNPEKNCEEGKIASNYTKSLLTGKEVWLEYDINKEDDYGRTLAYVYLDEKGSEMLQEKLLEDGMANTMTIGANIRYSLHFRMIAMKAKYNKSGFWEENFWADE